MKEFYLLYHLARADFLERVRRYSFLLTLLVIVVVTYFFLPALDAPLYAIVKLGADWYRPIYNSAWIGVSVALLMAELFPLFGFYLVKNTIERDTRTGVGEIIATTPLSKPMYTLGKWLSNMAVFIAVLAVMIVASLVLQFIRAEEFQVDAWALVSPFLFILLPEMAFMAALAILFESIKWLRGGFGNLVYYVVYGLGVLLGDLQGINSVWPSVYNACAAHFPSCNRGRVIEINGLPLSEMPTFRFDGVSWTIDLLLPRLSWLILSIAIALAAAYFFHRFDPVQIGRAPFGELFERIKQTLWAFVVEPRPADEPDTAILDASAEPGPVAMPIVHLTPLTTGAGAGGGLALYARMLGAEFRLTFKGLGWWWYLIAAGILVSALVVPLELARFVILPLAMIWPVLIWGSLGVREVQHHTDPIVFALPYALRRQLSATWLVGVLLALGMSGAVIVRLALAGDWSSALAVLAGALFVPSLALALGCWSGSSKLFQAIYVFLWYCTSVQGWVWVDFMGHIPDTVALGIPWLVAMMTLGLIGAAVAGRQRQITS